MKKKVSLADVSSSLNISKTTVSIVLNGKSEQFNISKQTQELIWAKAKELNYKPNFFAKSLREGKTKSIGLVLADISNSFYAELAKEMHHSCLLAGYQLFIVNSNDEPETEQKLIKELTHRAMDGLIIVPCSPEEELKDVLKHLAIPVVFLDRSCGVNYDFIGIDNKKEAAGIIHQLKVTPKHITIVQPVHFKVESIQLRSMGISEYCSKVGISFGVVHLDNDLELSENTIKKELKRGEQLFIALNNQVATVLMSTLRSLNVALPDEVQLISFDDSAAFPFFAPAVSALSQPVLDLAHETVQRMLIRLDNQQIKPKHTLLPCNFISRETH